MINSLLIMQTSFSHLETEDENNITENELKEMAKQTYDHLIVYLTGVRELYDKGIDAKNKMEEILEISDNALPDFG